MREKGANPRRQRKRKWNAVAELEKRRRAACALLSLKSRVRVASSLPSTSHTMAPISPTATLTEEQQKEDLALPAAAMVNMDEPAVDAKPSAGPAGVSPGQDPSTILTGKKLAVVFTAMLLSLLLIALE